MKSEPHVFSFDNLKSSPGMKTGWEGVRNYQARNFMRDRMKIGDKVLFYHSSCPQPGIPGLAVVCREAYADPTQFDKKSEYFDPKATKENPRWFQVDVKFESDFNRFVSLADLKEEPDLADFQLLKRGNRLSILPVEKEFFKLITRLSQK